MKSVMALVLAGSSVAVAQDAVQWRVEDGGNGHWYQFEPESLNWDQSQAIAEAQNGYLATTTSFEEVQFALSVLEGNAAYIGGVQFPQPGDEPDGGWTWVTGEPWIFTDWPPSEPSNGGTGGEDHLEILGTSSPCWNDVPNAPRPDRGYLIEWSEDCNNDGLVDYGQILNHELLDSDGDLVPDVCQKSYASFQSSTDTVRIYGNTVFPNVDFTYEFRIRVDASSVFGNVFGEQRDSLEEKVVGVAPDFFRGSITRGPLCGNIDETDVNNGELDEWTHLAWVREGEESRLFINGSLEKVWNDLDECIFDSPDSVMSVGLHMHSTGTIIPGFVGDIDWLRVSSTARYSENFLPPCESELVTDGQTEVLITFNISPFVSEFTEQSSNEFRCVMGDLPGGSSPVIQQDENKFGCGDCDGDGISDGDEIANGSASDFNSNGIPDNCEADCDADGIADFIEIDQGIEFDCNVNAIPDGCELADGSAEDANGNTFLDACEIDCNGNGVFDFLDLFAGSEQDCTGNGVPDICDIAEGSEPDCDLDGVPDACETFADCDGNGVPDSCDPDCDSDGIPDACEGSEDCDGNGIPDECQTDVDSDGIIDACDPDDDGDGIEDGCDVDNTMGEDCNLNGIDDTCDPDFDGDLIPDACDEDDDGDGIEDQCDVDSFENDLNHVLRLDSVGACVQVSHDPRLNPSDEITIEFWFRPSNMTQVGRMVTKRPGDAGAFTITYSSQGSSSSVGVDYFTAPACGYDTPNTSFQYLDQWHHCAVVASDSSEFIKIYMDGALAAEELEPEFSGPDCFLGQDGSPLRFGNTQGFESEIQFFGSLDNVRFWNEAFDLDKVNYWMRRPLFDRGVPKSDSLIAAWNFEGNATDVTGEHDGAILGGAFLEQSGSIYNFDCNQNGILDSCELPTNDCNANGIPDDCDDLADCNANGIGDVCDIDSGTSIDVNMDGIPDECQCVPDIVADGVVDFTDLLTLLNEYGPCPPPCRSDLNGDGVVNFEDLLQLLSVWGACK